MSSTASPGLSSVLIDQRQRWQRGECVSVEALLEESPSLREQAEAAMELVYHEMLLREERGAPPELDEYLRRFPQFASEVRLQFEVHAALKAVPEPPAPELTYPVDLNNSGVATPLEAPGYEILRELGRGGMGVVYMARQVALNRIVALKMIRAGMHAAPHELDRFRREAAVVAQLHHPNIVQIFEIETVGGLPYLALEFVDGVSLDRAISGKPLPPRSAAELLETMARAMHYAHQRGVIHRDLKPANILLAGVPPTPDSWTQTPVPKITDFGLAKILEAGAAGPTRSGDVVGTPAYMAPEQATGKPGDLSVATDVYSLGAILYEMLTGRAPFVAPTVLATLDQVRFQEPVSPSRLQAKLPRDLVTICLTCLHKDPAKRFASADDLADDLHRFLNREPIHARPTGLVERTLKWMRRRPMVAALTAAVVTVAAVGFGVFWWQFEQTRTALQRTREEQVKTRQAHDETKAHLYLNQIGLALHEVMAHHGGRADRLLLDTDPELRGWEWHYLQRLAQTDLFTLRGHRNEIRKVAFSPDGRLVAAGSGDWSSGQEGDLKIWNARTGELMHTLAADLRTIYSVAFSPDGATLASGCADSVIRLYDVHDGSLTSELRGHTGWVYCMAYSPDGSMLASSGTDGVIRIWDTTTGTCRHVLRKHTSAVWNVLFSPDGRFLVSASHNWQVYFWDPLTGEHVRTISGLGDLRAAAISPDGAWLALGVYQGTIWLLDLRRPDAQPAPQHPNAGPIMCVQFSPDSRRFVWSSYDGSIKLRDIRTGRDVQVFRGHQGMAESMCLSPDGQRLASGGVDRTVRIWDTTAHEDSTVWLEESAFITSLSHLPDKRLIAVGSFQQSLRIWDVAANKLLNKLPNANDPATATVVSADGRVLAWVADGETLHGWDLNAGQSLYRKQLNSGPVTGLAISPDSRQMAWGGIDGFVRLCNPQTGEQIAKFGPHASGVSGVAFHPKLRKLATAGRDGSFAEWDLDAKTALVQFGAGHEGSQILDEQQVTPRHVSNVVTRVAYSPDGRRLAVANFRRPIEIWDMSTHRVAITLDWEGTGVVCVGWSLDGQRTYAARWGRVATWDASPQEREARVQSAATRGLHWHGLESKSAAVDAHWWGAAWHLDRLIAAQPNEPAHRRARLRGAAEMEQWGRADADAAHLLKLGGADADLYYQRACLALQQDDPAAYRRLCKECLREFGDTTNPATANTLAWTCVLAPGGVASYDRVVALAEHAVKMRPKEYDPQNTLATALLRADRPRQAIEAFELAIAVHPQKLGMCVDWLGLALAYSRLGDAHRADDCLAKAATFSNEGLNWQQRIELRLMRQEANKIVND